MVLNVTGMTCGHCKTAVQKALEAVGGVTAVNVDLDNGSAQVEGTAQVEQLIAAVEEEGYNARVV